MIKSYINLHAQPGKLRSNLKVSETERFFCSMVEIQRTAKLLFLTSVVEHWKWWLNLWIKWKTSAAVTWPAKDLIWMSLGISFSIESERTSNKSYFRIIFHRWRCLLFNNQMKMSSSENYSRQAHHVHISHEAWPTANPSTWYIILPYTAERCF